MAKRWPNGKRVKRLRTYTVEEAANLLGKHKHTIRNWIKSGLPLTDDRRPQLIMGAELVQFLAERRQRTRQKCGPGQIFCLPCRSPQTPAGNFVEYIPRSSALGNLRGICPVCDRLMHRNVNLAGLAEMRRYLEIAFPLGEPRLN